jgi:hypothetical protein
LNGLTVIAASPGYDLLAVTKREGKLHSVPVIGWTIRVQEDGGAEMVQPVLPRPVAHHPDVAYAVRWPDGRVHDLGTDCFYRSVEEWVFSVRTQACGHELVGTA